MTDDPQRPGVRTVRVRSRDDHPQSDSAKTHRPLCCIPNPFRITDALASVRRLHHSAALLPPHLLSLGFFRSRLPHLEVFDP